jgi:hypothetical protein
MTNVDWEPLREANPVPGDPYAVQDLARHFAERAATIDDVVRRLEALDTGDLQSSAVTELQRLRGELVPDLRHLELRYERAAGALRPFCAALERAQDMARDAARMAQEAERERNAAEAGVEALQQQAEDLRRTAERTGQPPVPQLNRDWNAALDDASGQMTAAERLMQDAEELYHDAARNCANAIEDAAEDALQNEGGLFGAVGEFFDDVGEGIGAATDWVGDRWTDAGGWVADNWPSLEEWSNILGYVAAGLGILSLFPPLAFLAPVAAAVGVAKLVIDVNLWRSGRQGFGAVALGAFGLATFGLGRIYTAAARGTAGAAAAAKARDLAARTGPGSLRGITAVTANGNRIVGAAARSHNIKVFGGAASKYGTSASTKLLPKGRHIVEAFAKWNLDEPAREILTLSPLAVKLNRVANVSGGIGSGLDADEMLGEPLGNPIKEHVFGDAPKD